MNNKIIKEDVESIIATTAVNWDRFKNSTVLVTGANGFLPAYMVEVILYLNEHVFPLGQQAKIIVFCPYRH